MKPQEMSRTALERAASHHEEAMNRLRKAIGLIGFLLPSSLLASVFLFGVEMQDSISEFFFTPMRDVFVLTLSGIGTFLITYYGHDPDEGDILTDWSVSTVAGITALAVALIPTGCDAAPACYHPLTLLDGLIASDRVQQVLHFGAAGIFLIALALMCLKLFTKSDRPDPGPHKARRNLIYRICGWVILAMVAALLVVKLLLGDPFGWDASWHFTFWAEAIAVWAFGIAWLVKGEAMAGAMTFLHDPDETSADLSG